jgi:hypothetical protein
MKYNATNALKYPAAETGQLFDLPSAGTVQHGF